MPGHGAALQNQS